MANGASSSSRFRIDYLKAWYFALWGAGGGAAGALLGEPISQLRHLIPDQPVLGSAAWFSVVGALIALCLLLGQSLYLRNGFALRKNTWLGTVHGCISGLGAGAIAEMVYQTGPNEPLRVLCWGIAGGFLGLALSFRIPNLGRLRGGGGGFIGGLLGGILFIALSSVLAQIAGRLGGIAAIGGFIGVIIVLAESAFREVWLEVAYGPKEVRKLSLGAELVSFGGDPSLCTVYARGAAPKAYAYRLEQGRIVCEDVATGRRADVRPGHRQQIGNIAVTVCGTASPSAKPAQTTVSTAPKLQLKFSASRVYPLPPGRRFSPQDIPGLESASGVVAEVNTNPQDASILGLKNLSQREWVVKMPDGTIRRVQAGQSFKLAVGSHIQFGATEADIIAE